MQIQINKLIISVHDKINFSAITEIPIKYNGKSISVILNSFNRNEDLKRILKLRLFDEERLLVERDLIIEGHLEFNVMDILPRKLPDGAIWYVLSGDCLEDLIIFSTFYPKDIAGFTEHAF